MYESFMEINDDVWGKFKLAKFRWGCGGLTLAARQVKPQLLNTPSPLEKWE